jgi:RNA polymerase subunit RPABC4/transcription elongation factor Spt4
MQEDSERPLASPRACPFCSAIIPEDAPVCPNCGKEVAMDAVEERPTQ